MRISVNIPMICPRGWRGEKPGDTHLEIVIRVDPTHHVLSIVCVVVVDARFGPGRSFCCASIFSTRAVASTWFSSTTATRSAVTRRSASRHEAFTGSFIRRGQCAVAPRSTMRPHTSPLSPTLTQLPLRCNKPSTVPATTALFVSRCLCPYKPLYSMVYTSCNLKMNTLQVSYNNNMRIVGVGDGAAVWGDGIRSFFRARKNLAVN